jgi:hypothetical protein
VRASRAPAGESFAPKTQIASDLALRAATFGGTGGLVIAGVQTGGRTDLYSGPFAAQRIAPDGTAGPATVLEPGGAGTVLAAATPAGNPVLAWTPTGDRALRVSVAAAP